MCNLKKIKCIIKLKKNLFKLHIIIIGVIKIQPKYRLIITNG